MAANNVIARAASSERGMPAPVAGLIKFLHAIKPFDLFLLVVLALLWSMG